MQFCRSFYCLIVLLLHLAISDTLRCVLPLQPARLKVLQKLGVELLLRGLAIQILRVVLHIVHTSEILTWRFLTGAADDPSVSQSVSTITEKAPNRAFSWLKAHTRGFKTLCKLTLVGAFFAN